jgi:hypothetical protein
MIGSRVAGKAEAERRAPGIVSTMSLPSKEVSTSVRAPRASIQMARP